MKRFSRNLLAVILAVLLLMSALPLTAFAEESKPTPTSGPTENVSIFGGARAGVYDTATRQNFNVVYYDYTNGGLKINNSAVSGMTYDKAANTLTVENVHQRDNELFIWYMGDDFKLNVKGENEFGVIFVYNGFDFHSTSLNIVGDGTLTVNEQRRNDIAIQMVANGAHSLMHLDIADTVTVHLYSAEGEEGEDPNPVAALSSTRITTAEGGAITIGGVAIPEAQGKQIIVEEPDYVPALIVDRSDREVVQGTMVTPKSTTDAEGKYALSVMDGVIYLVSRYMYVDELGMWVVDQDFSDKGFIGRRYSKEEFEEQYDYVYGMAPTQVAFMDTYQYENRGWSAAKLTRADEPGAVYAGEVDWEDDFDDPHGFTVYRVVWSDADEIYFKDDSYTPKYIARSELEAEGFTLPTEDIERRNELTVWSSDDPEDDDRWEMTCEVIRRKSAPDDLYVQIGTYSSSSGETGISIQKVHFDPETEEFYILYADFSSAEYMTVSDAELESGEEFYYDIENVTRPIEIRYINASYSFDEYAEKGVLLSKKDDPDNVYAYKQWTHYSGGSGSTVYAVIRLESRNGHYFEDEDFEEQEFYDLSDLEWMGYEIVESYQPLDYKTKGSVDRLELPLYTDNDGNRYYADYNDNVYSFTESDLFQIGSEKYYWGVPEYTLSMDDLNDTVHEVVTDNYSYLIPGTEYHHTGGQGEYTEYALWVNGEQFNSDRLMIPCGKGSAVYDPARNTLTLHNAEITKGAEKDWTYSGVLSQMANLTVIISGDCTISETGGDGIGTYNSESYQIGDVIYPAPYDLTITGDGTLTITESTPIYGYGLYCTGNLSIEGVKLHINSAAAGIWASDLKMKQVEADIHTSSWYSGIVINRGSFAFDDSTVTAQSAEGAALLLGNDQDNSVLTVEGGELDLRGKLGVQGVVDQCSVVVNSGTLRVEGENAAFDETYLADNAKYIVMGEGVSVVSGDIFGKAVVISSASLLGDVDGSGDVMIVDATYIQRHIVGVPIPFTLNETVADTDGDGAVTIVDATYIQRWLANLTSNDNIGKPI